MEGSKKLAARILSNLGFRVEAIPEGKRRTADLAIRDEQSLYHIEVKEKFESSSSANTRHECLNRGDLYEQTDTLGHDNRISGIFREAGKQLEATSCGTGAFNLIWFHANGIDADLKFRQAFATFYGPVDLVAIWPRQPATKACFYFDYSAAFSMPNVEALILTDHKTLQVCLNEFSHRSGEFSRSQLCESLRKLNSDAIVDPKSMAAEGRIIACRSDLPRKSDDETCRALRDQTGVLYKPIRLKRYTFSAAVQPKR
jgi:hypothetical protein